VSTIQPGGPELAARLRAAGCVFAEEEADLLLEAAGSAAELERLVRAREGGTPLEQLLGWVGFCGLRIAVEPGVFVPRQRTALLVAEAARLVRPGDVVVDLCCGSGAIGAALLAAEPSLELHAADVEAAAVRNARRNLGTAGQVHRGDLFGALPEILRGRVAVVTCNAPYVPSAAIALMPPEARDHEPAVALDGGPDGLDVARSCLRVAARHLLPGAPILVQLGGRDQAATLAVEPTGLRVHEVRDGDGGVLVLLRAADG